MTEAHFHPTGYSVYTKEVLSRLHKYPELEVAELACFTGPEAPEIADCPWKFYPNIPPSTNAAAINAYNSSMPNKFGEFSFNSVLLDFQPDFVMDIRDEWMQSYQLTSPFRDFFKLAWMPTVDASPQNPMWINSFTELDALFTYSEFGRDTVLKQCPKLRNIFQDVASPCASEIFNKFDEEAKKELRRTFGIPQDAVIFGTVMRNQRRKLFPDLMKAFRLFLDSYKHENVYLYLHTGYPDVGWEIPELIMEYGLSKKVLMTYQCRNCKKVEALHFCDAFKFCHNCNSFSSTLVGVNNKMDESYLNLVYNLFDVYIQWANCEGFGMPALEAAFAGLPIVMMNYSAMASIAKNVEGIPVDPLGFYKELETGCNRAVPDNHALAKAMNDLMDPVYRAEVANQCYNNSHTIYNWDFTADKWKNYFLKTEVPDHSRTWKSPPRIFRPAQQLPHDISSVPVVDQVNWLFANVLGRPDWINRTMWRKMVKDLTYHATVTSTLPGYYFNDHSHPDLERKYEEFTIQKAFEICTAARNVWNRLEEERAKRI